MDDDLSNKDFPVRDKCVDGSSLASSIKDGQVAIDGIYHLLWWQIGIGLCESYGGICGQGQRFLAPCPGLGGFLCCLPHSQVLFSFTFSLQIRSSWVVLFGLG